MKELFKRLFRGSRIPSEGERLAARLKHYPPYEIPHAGPAKALSEHEANENLDFFLDQKPARLDALDALLHDEEISLKESLTIGKVLPLVDELHQWADSTWPGAIAAERRDREVWQCTHYRDEDILYTLAHDVAVALGELVRFHQPRFEWAIDRLPDNVADGMPSVNRVVLISPSPSGLLVPTVLDWESMVASVVFDPGLDRVRVVNDWKITVTAAIDGLH